MYLSLVSLEGHLCLFAPILHVCSSWRAFSEKLLFSTEVLFLDGRVKNACHKGLGSYDSCAPCLPSHWRPQRLWMRRWCQLIGGLSAYCVLSPKQDLCGSGERAECTVWTRGLSWLHGKQVLFLAHWALTLHCVLPMVPIRKGSSPLRRLSEVFWC